MRTNKGISARFKILEAHGWIETACTYFGRVATCRFTHPEHKYDLLYHSEYGIYHENKPK